MCFLTHLSKPSEIVTSHLEIPSKYFGSLAGQCKRSLHIHWIIYNLCLAKSFAFKFVNPDIFGFWLTSQIVILGCLWWFLLFGAWTTRLLEMSPQLHLPPIAAWLICLWTSCPGLTSLSKEGMAKTHTTPSIAFICNVGEDDLCSLTL